MLNITLDVDRTSADARDEQTSIVRSTPAARRRRLIWHTFISFPADTKTTGSARCTLCRPPAELDLWRWRRVHSTRRCAQHIGEHHQFGRIRRPYVGCAVAVPRRAHIEAAKCE